MHHTLPETIDFRYSLLTTETQLDILPPQAMFH